MNYTEKISGVCEILRSRLSLLSFHHLRENTKTCDLKYYSSGFNMIRCSVDRGGMSLYMESTSHCHRCLDRADIVIPYDMTLEIEYDISSEGYYDSVMVFVNRTKAVLKKAGVYHGSVVVNVQRDDIVTVLWYKDGSVSRGRDNVNLHLHEITHKDDSYNINNVCCNKTDAGEYGEISYASCIDVETLPGFF